MRALPFFMGLLVLVFDVYPALAFLVSIVLVWVFDVGENRRRVFLGGGEDGGGGETRGHKWRREWALGKRHMQSRPPISCYTS